MLFGLVLVQIIRLSTCFTEMENSSSALEDDFSGSKSLHNISSVTDSQGKKSEPENYVSSVRTVALCVRAYCIVSAVLLPAFL